MSTEDERFTLQLMDRLRDAWAMRWPNAVGTSGEQVVSAFWVQGFIAGMRYAVHHPHYTGYAARRLNRYAAEKDWPDEPVDYITGVIGAWASPVRAMDGGDFSRWLVEQQDKYHGPTRIEPIKASGVDFETGEVLWHMLGDSTGQPDSSDEEMDD